jgi:hypothetical protein
VSDFDGSWKEALEYDLPGFLAFFLPPAHAAIDWAADHESLEQELRELLPQGDTGRRLCDKLIKATGKESGDPAYLHLEVQNQAEADFERRVYVYNYRAEDKYNQPVVSFVVLGDDRDDWRPRAYVYERWGCKKTFEFPSVKLLDFRGREADLEAHANPFALMVLAHLKALETRKDMEARRDAKVRLFRLLVERKMEGEDLRQWFRCVDWILALPDPWQKQVMRLTRALDEEKNMPRLTSFERLGKMEGLQRGIAVGLELKFGSADPSFLQAIENVSLETLEQIIGSLKTANSLDDLRRLLPPANGQNGAGG